MKKIASYAPLILTCSVLVGVFVALATIRFEICDQTPAPQLPMRVASIADVPVPTPAPPCETVTVTIHADRQGLEVGWARN